MVGGYKMIKIDLVTGFLGSGKTTFIKQYAKYLLKQGLKICILENDYGVINVDMMLLGDLLSDKCNLEMVIGGDKDCRIRRFKTKLIAMGMDKYDRVIIEPSGVFDVDEFYDTLYEEPLCNWYEIGNVFSIVDATLNLENDDIKYVVASEVATSGRVIISKFTANTDLNDIKTKLDNALEFIGCNRKIDEIIFAKDLTKLDDNDFKVLIHSLYNDASFVKRRIDDFTSLFFMNKNIDENKIRNISNVLFNDDTYGNVIRIKGFYLYENSWYEVNACKNEITISKISNGQDVIIVIGINFNEEKINLLF